VSSPTIERAKRFLEEGQAKRAASLLSALNTPESDDDGVQRLLAQALYQDRQLLAALRIFDSLARKGKATARDWYLMGEALFDLGEQAQSIGILERALKMQPRSAGTLHRLAWSAYRLGDVDRAVKLLEKAARYAPERSIVMSLATIVPGAPSASQRKILKTRLRMAKLLADSDELTQNLETNPQEHQPGKIKVGYLSAHFGQANYMKPVWSLVNHHDRQAFRVFLYSDSEDYRRMPGYRPQPNDRIRGTHGRSNQQIADMVAEDGIDILVDLNAFSASHRLDLFTSRRAPVVVAWFNMYATSGLPGFDYIVGDEETVLPGEDRFYTERVERLPISYLTFEVSHRAPPVQEPPSLTNGFLTFGSLVSQYKMTPQVMDAWARLLRKASGSHLFIANAEMKSIHNQDWLRKQFTKRGVKAERIEISGPAEHYQYLQYYDRMDIALDAWPYNGGTTTMEALWQGVPVMTLAGDRWAARTSQTLLKRAGLADWVYKSPRHLIRQASRMSAQPNTAQNLTELRHGMRERLLNSPACDGPSLARSMESFYQRVAHAADRHGAAPPI
jgi:predicted O-linked N-acetylglucosamine transferase (SPINDLY family)